MSKCSKCGDLTPDDWEVVKDAIGMFIDGSQERKGSKIFALGKERVAYNEYCDMLIKDADEVYVKLFGHSYIESVIKGKAEFERAKSERRKQ